MILVLLGPPGAGKGTQAKLLAWQYGVPHVSTGDMFRDHTARATKLGRKIQAVMDAGGLVTDEITNAMVDERLSRPDLAKGFILDGYPRTTAQAEHLEDLLRSMRRSIDRVVSYEVPAEVVVARVAGRRSCAMCGALYHLGVSPPRRPGSCDRDGAGLVQRRDDKPENVRKRLEEYADKTRPLKRFYQARRLLTEIEGVGTPQAILASTQGAMRSEAETAA
jgi:adenylate kinase